MSNRGNCFSLATDLFQEIARSSSLSISLSPPSTAYSHLQRSHLQLHLKLIDWCCQHHPPNTHLKSLMHIKTSHRNIQFIIFGFGKICTLFHTIHNVKWDLNAASLSVCLCFCQLLLYLEFVHSRFDEERRYFPSYPLIPRARLVDSLSRWWHFEIGLYDETKSVALQRQISEHLLLRQLYRKIELPLVTQQTHSYNGSFLNKYLLMYGRC